MHCPNCGTKTSTKHRFCRYCGMSLEKFAELLGEQQLSEAAAGTSPLVQRQKRVEQLLGGVVVSVITILVFAVLYGIIFRVMIAKGEYLKGGIFLVFILGLVTALCLVIYNESLKEKMTQRPQANDEPSEPGTTARLLPDDSLFEPAQSVTDRTTELLEVKREGGAETP